MIKILTGNEAAAYGALLCKPAVVCAYPITPQSRIPEQISEFCARGIMKAKFVNVESETAALGYVIGASSAGVRTFTATSSQGLALMHEQLHWAAGVGLPIVMANVNRTLGAPTNIGCEQNDSLSQRDTGWLQFYCETNQEVLDTVIQAYKISESISLPSMVCLDGVYLSYISENTEIPDQEKVDAYLPPYAPTIPNPGCGWKILYKHAPPGNYMVHDFMQYRYHLHKQQNSVLSLFSEANREFKELFGRGYVPVEEYRCDDAETVLVMSGSAVGTARTVIDRLREEGFRVGLIKLKVFRPFPREIVRKVLGGRRKVAVIERDVMPGQCGIFYQEIKWALSRETATYGFVAGLGGADITFDLIEKGLRYMLREDPPDQEVIWLGLSKRVSDDYDRNAITVL